MISIIISTYRKNYLAQVASNIKKTIGNVAYEIIEIENPDVMGIATAYNHGASRAKYNYLIFLHEDVSFSSKNWGKKVVEILKEQEAGILGLAGNEKKFSLPTGCETGINLYRHVFVVHSTEEKLKKKAPKDAIPVRTLDGVFLAMTAERWKEFKFNEDIPGFHFYDLDISLRVSNKYQNYVIPTISLKHFSLGNFGDRWITKCIKFHKRDYIFDICSNEEKELVRKFWYSRLMSEKISFYNRFMYIQQMGFSLDSWRQALKFLYK